MYSSIRFYYLLIPLITLIVLLRFNKVFIREKGLILNILLLILLSNSEKGFLLFIIYIPMQMVNVLILWEMKKRLENDRLKKLVYFISLTFGLLPLILSKVYEILPNHTLTILGISYITFRVVGTIVEINDGIIKKMDFKIFLYYISFFPTVVSGPIDRYRRFKDDIHGDDDKIEYLNLTAEGVFKFISGFAFKFIFAQIIDFYFIKSSGDAGEVIHVIKYMYAYSFYLYFDFLGYSLMAVGLSNLLGIRVPKNFNKPFLSTNIKEFWNRWHMSLSFWFRDFIYSRFVLKTMKKKYIKNKYLASYVGYMITMTTMGIWHGLYTNYIVYGIYHGLLICFTDFSLRKFKSKNKKKSSRLGTAISILITFNLVAFGFLIFSGYLFGSKISFLGS